jgi:hypothetical protein
MGLPERHLTGAFGAKKRVESRPNCRQNKQIRGFRERASIADPERQIEYLLSNSETYNAAKWGDKISPHFLQGNLLADRFRVSPPGNFQPRYHAGDIAHGLVWMFTAQLLRHIVPFPISILRFQLPLFAPRRRRFADFWAGWPVYEPQQLRLVHGQAVVIEP